MSEQIERERDLAWQQHLEQKARAAGNEPHVPPHKGGAQWFNAPKHKAPAAPSLAPKASLHRRQNAEERAAYLVSRHDRPQEAVGTPVFWPNCWYEKYGVIIATPGDGRVKVRFSDGRVMNVLIDYLTTPPAESAAA